MRAIIIPPTAPTAMPAMAPDARCLGGPTEGLEDSTEDPEGSTEGSEDSTGSSDEFVGA